MSKPKLLITMGCSYTEGVGCYDVNSIPKNIPLDRFNFTTDYRDLWNELYEKNLPRFHELGWPNKLGKKLNYNKVLNLGLGGSSHSGQLKVFIEKYSKEKFEDYEVLVLWFLTEPTRISFYKGGTVENLMVNHMEKEGISGEYFKFIQDIDFDPLLEQIFYVRIMNQICENKNWNFLATHTHFKFNSSLELYDPSNYYLNMDGIDVFNFEQVGGYDKNTSLLCQHPNENGYENIAKKFYNQIKKYHPNYINTNIVSHLEWKWDGHPLNWIKYE